MRLLFSYLLISASIVNAQKADSLLFTESAVTIELKDITLYGTYTLPAAAKEGIPIVLIIAGSGATDRNGNNMSAGLHCDSYKQLAHALAANNIATLRYDKRGVGQSKPASPAAERTVFETEVNDAAGLVDHLRKDKRFSEIIIAGHSQGALVGMLASGNTRKFISLCGLALDGSETIRQQLSVQPAIVSEKANPIIDSLKQGYRVTSVPTFLEPLFKPAMQPYLISWFRYDPGTELSKLKIPSLIIQGENDIQIRTGDAQAYAAKSERATLLIIPGMNHVFKITPANREENLKAYADPSIPVSEELIAAISRFVLK